MIEMLVNRPITPDSRRMAITTAPTHETIDIQNVEGVTQLVRREPLAGLENIASMKASATGSTADSTGPGGGTAVSGTRVKRFGTRQA